MSINSVIFSRTRKLHIAKDVHFNDGDWDLVADALAEAITGLTDQDSIKAAIRTAAFAEADSGMCDKPGLVATEITAVVMAELTKTTN